jgi:hypothetical protein
MLLPDAGIQRGNSYSLSEYYGASCGAQHARILKQPFFSLK